MKHQAADALSLLMSPREDLTHADYDISYLATYELENGEEAIHVMNTVDNCEATVPQ